jgi:type I restriction enzyme S subunit
LVSLGTLCSFANGVNANKDAYGKGIRFINVLEVITCSHLRATDVPGRVLLSKVAREAFAVRRGDVLFNRTSETQEEVGLSAVYDDDEAVVFGGFVIRGRFTSDVLDKRYTGYAFRASIMRSQIVAQGQGAIRANIGQENLKRVLVPIPSKTEQRAIAAAFSDVDGLLGALQALISKKRAIKQAAMQQLLTGKTRLPGFSGDWETKRMGEIGKFRGGIGFPTALQGTPSGEYPFFKVSDMNSEGNETFMEVANNYISERTRKALGATAFPAMSIVFAKVGAAVFLERKKLLSKASCLDNNMAAFVLDGSAADCRFVHYLFLDTTLGDLVSTTALPSLSGSVLGMIECLFPSMDEQQAIATVLSDMDAEIAALEARRDKTHAIKQGMMQQLLTGRIRLVEPLARS